MITYDELMLSKCTSNFPYIAIVITQCRDLVVCERSEVHFSYFQSVKRVLMILVHVNFEWGIYFRLEQILPHYRGVLNGPKINSQQALLLIQ